MSLPSSQSLDDDRHVLTTLGAGKPGILAYVVFRNITKAWRRFFLICVVNPALVVFA